MFIKEVTAQFAHNFKERSITSKFNKGTYTITTISRNNKPVAKQYLIDTPNKIIHCWKNMIKKTKHFSETNKLDINI